MRILQDEAFITAPISTALAYSRAAMSGNWKNTAIVASILLLLILVEMLPLIGLVASVLQGIILYAMAWWIAQLMRQSPDLERFRSVVAAEDAKNPMTAYFGPGAGFYLGFMIFSMIMMLVTVAIMWLTGGFAAIGMGMEQMQNLPADSEQAAAVYAQMFGAGAPALAFLIITSLFFGYLWPLVYGYALTQTTFGDAFGAIFMLFSTRFWKASFTGAYFRLVTLWMLILMVATIALAVCFGLFILIPVGILILMWMVYFTAAVSLEAYNFSDGV
ncbi:hypothetical protein [Hydrogenimonas sp.]